MDIHLSSMLFPSFQTSQAGIYSVIMRLLVLLMSWSVIGIDHAQSESVLSKVSELDPRSMTFDKRHPQDLIASDQGITFDPNWLQNDDSLNPTVPSDSDLLLGSGSSVDSTSSNLFFDSGSLDELDPNLFSANDNVVCDLGNAGETQLFGKRRRGESCRDPVVGKNKNPSGSDQGEPFNLNEPFKLPTDAFPEDTDLCPTRIFGASKIPVCSSLVEEILVLVPGARYFTLLDVHPRRSSMTLLGFATAWLMLIGRTRTHT